jgi:hypothetical protein
VVTERLIRNPSTAACIALFNDHDFCLQMFYNSFYVLFAETDQLTCIHITCTHFTRNMSRFFSITDVSGFDSPSVLEIISSSELSERL